MNEHKFHVCKSKKYEARTFYRKDKLKQHLQQVHALSESCSALWETWNQAPKKKWAWGCGYCGACSFTWEGMFLLYISYYLHTSQVLESLMYFLEIAFPVYHESSDLQSRNVEADSMYIYPTVPDMQVTFRQL